MHNIVLSIVCGRSFNDKADNQVRVPGLMIIIFLPSLSLSGRNRKLGTINPCDVFFSLMSSVVQFKWLSQSNYKKIFIMYSMLIHFEKCQLISRIIKDRLNVWICRIQVCEPLVELCTTLQEAFQKASGSQLAELAGTEDSQQELGVCKNAT